ncbi:MAG: hypothetical protein ACXWJW_04480 [Xanthobacteraceae bacterium]
MYPFLSRVRRLADGSIDFDYYRRRAMRIRRGRIRYMFRQRAFYRRALYAGAVAVGLIIGVTIPLGPVDCRNCGTTIIDTPQGAELDLLRATTYADHKVSNTRPSID